MNVMETRIPAVREISRHSSIGNMTSSNLPTISGMPIVHCSY